MAFRTNKTPAIEERTVSGSSVSFNSAFALPLKKCEVSFMATQSGSGTPSPQNVRPIVPVSSLDVVVNGSTISKNLGDNYYGGTLDLVSGILTPKYVAYRISSFYTTKQEPTSTYPLGFFLLRSNPSKKAGTTNLKCEVFNTKATFNEDNTIRGGVNNDYIYIIDSQYANVSAMREAVGNNYICYELETPLAPVQLTPTQLSTIIGNNTFSTDTGTLEITFSDLQEKSASSAVASFNTALAMPLPSCNIAVNAWQEGSGEPSPSNVRPIHGFDKVRIDMVNFNQYIDEKTDYDTPQTVNGVTISRNGKAFTISGDCVVETPRNIDVSNGCSIFTPNDIYLAVCFKSGWSGETNNWYIAKVGTGSNVFGNNREYRIFRLPSNWTGKSWLMRVPLADGKHYDFTFYPQMFNLTQMFGSKMAEQILTAEQGQAGSGYAMFRQLFYKSWYDYNEGGTWVSVASVNGDSYPDYAEIQLGQEVYGAEVDVVNGVATVAWGKKTIADLSFIAQSGNRFTATISDCVNTPNFTGFLCSTYKPILVNANNNTWLSNRVITIVDNRYTMATEFKEAMGDTQIVYPLAEPFDIQLTPQQIETLIGNNTIFADTGDIDLTYKDLDIAKRGNFREVFKLPS